MKQQPAPWYYYICWSNRSPLCYRESMNCCVSLLLCEGASWTSLCWSIIWVYWSSWRTGRCRLRSLQQVITSPWRNTGMVLPREQEIYLSSVCFIMWLVFYRSSAKFFSSNGQLRDVNEVNKMNESLQSELQVSSSRKCVWTCLLLHTHGDSACVFCVGQKACGDVEESERLVETLQADVSALRRRLREKKQSSVGKGSLLKTVVWLRKRD